MKARTGNMYIIMAVQALVLSLFLLGNTPLYAQEAQEQHPDNELLQVNINQADAETIALILDGIGRARAEAIVRYRHEHGPFRSLEDLTMVSGIGEVTVRNNRDRILFE